MKPIVRIVKNALFGGFLLAVLGIAAWFTVESRLPPSQSKSNSPHDTVALWVNLPPGSVRVVSEQDGLWSIASNEASLEAILRKTADAMHFTLKMGTLRNARLSVRLNRETMEKVIKKLLHGYPFRPEFAYDDASGRHYISVLEVGLAGQSRFTELDRADKDAVSRTLRASTTKGSFRSNEPPNLTEPVLQNEVDLLMSEHIGNQLLAHESPSQTFEGPPEQRVAVIANVIPFGDNLNRLISLLEDDPDPMVRTAAAKQLALAGGRPASSRALLEALKDEDKMVVLEALASIVQTGDSSLSEEIELAAQRHTDADVRKSLAATAEQLRSRPRMEADEFSNSN